jgi:hypothetical protein
MGSAAQRPSNTEFAPFYGRYIDLAPEGDIIAQLRENGATLAATLTPLDDTRAGFRYASDKWSVREIIGHLIDSERIFVYRALRIARGDTTPLAGFEQNDYVSTADSDARALADLRDEHRALRESTVRFFGSLSEAAWTRTGVASNSTISVRALARIVLGHTHHHLRVLADKYQVPTQK